MHLICSAVLIFVLQSAAFGYVNFEGYCQQGGQVVVGPGSSQSTTKVQQSYPSATLTVYITGSSPLTKATLFSDNNGTALANPLTCSTKGYFSFYAENGILDLTFSGTGISSPFTWGGVQGIDPNTIAGVVNVAQFGAKCNGTTSDTSAFLASISAAPAGSVISMPPGSCRVGSLGTMTKQLKFLGNGTTILPDTTGDWITLPLLNENKYFVFQDLNFKQYASAVPTSFFKVNAAINTKWINVNINQAQVSVAFLHHVEGYGDSWLGGGIRGNTAPSMMFFEHDPGNGPFTYGARVVDADFTNNTGKGITIQGGELTVQNTTIESESLGGIEHVLNTTSPSTTCTTYPAGSTYCNSWYLTLSISNTHFEGNSAFNVKFPPYVQGVNANSFSTATIEDSTFTTNPSSTSVFLGGKTFLRYKNNQINTACLEGNPAQVTGVVTYENIFTFGSPASCTSGPSGYLVKTDIYNVAAVVGPAVTGLNAPAISQTLQASGNIHEFWDNAGTRRAYVTVTGDWAGRDVLPTRQVLAGTFIGSTNGSHTWACATQFFVTDSDYRCQYDGADMYRWDNLGNYKGVATVQAAKGVLNAAYAFASLPVACSSGTKGTQLFVIDSSTSTFNAVITGGGANPGLALCDGINWRFH